MMINTSENNETTETLPEPLETDNMKINAMLLSISLITILLCVMAILALNRTNRVPFAPKLLSQLLLFLDILLLSTSCIRRFLSEPVINIQLNVFGMLSHMLAVVTVTAMTIERLYIFIWPNEYMRVITPRKILITVAVIWVSVAFMFYFMRFFVCSRFIEDPRTVFYVPWACNRIMLLYDISVVVVCYVINAVCYTSICRLIQEKNQTSSRQSSKSALKRILTYKATSFVLITFIMMLINSVFLSVLLFVIQNNHISVADTRLSLDYMRLANCIVDTFLYSLWFTESRIELLKIVSPLNRRWLEVANRMKFKAFNIVIYSRHRNRVYPVTDLAEM